MSGTSPAVAPAGVSRNATPQALVTQARTVLDGTIALGPAWARSVALLARQALEAALAEYWGRRVPGMDACSFTTQLVALRFYLDDPALAADAHLVWSSLSQACHHQGYDLAPTAAELTTWLDTVSAVIDRLAPSHP